MSLQHAQHNHALCQIIEANGGYNDWVCTTAFYAAMHYVYAKIFPLTKPTIIYLDFNHYYREKHSRKDLSKHEATVSLVSAELYPIHGKYRHLMNTSFTARYFKYNIQDAVKNQALENLRDIEAVCNP